MSEEKEHDFNDGDWFFATDGCVYEFVNDDIGSKRVCSIIDFEKTVFITPRMKAYGNIIAAAPKMYKYLNDLVNDRIEQPIDDSVIEKLLAEARGEQCTGKK